MDVRAEMATGTETVAAGGWLLGKILPGVAGMFGGLSLAVFWTPERLRQKGKIVGIFLAGGLSAIAGFAFTGLVAQWLGIDQQNLDAIVGLALLIGALWVAAMNMLANTVQARENLGLDEVAREINDLRKGKTPRAPAKKAPAKKTVRRSTK